MRGFSFVFLAYLARGLIAAATIAAIAGGAGAGEWLTGAALQKRLAQNESVAWADAPLRETLARFARTQGVAVLLDRRIDPGQPLTLSLSDAPLETILRDVALSLDLGVSHPGPLVYIGPVEAAKRLQTVMALRRDDLRGLPPVVSSKFLRSRPLAWDDFAEPRDLLNRLAEEAGVEIDGLDRVPHDLLAAAETPPLALVDRLTLLLAQFELTFSPPADGRRIELVPIPKEVAIERSYSGGSNAEETAGRLAALAPEARVRVADGRVYVSGLVEDHQRLAPPRTTNSGGRSGSAGPSADPFVRKRFTLRVEQSPLGQVLRQLGKQLKLDLRIDEAALKHAGVSLEQRVSFSVNEATIDELLQAAIQTVPVRYRRKGAAVEIGPAEGKAKNDE